VSISTPPGASGKVTRPDLTPWERLGLPPADSIAIHAVLGAITAATETPTYGAAMRDYIDDNTRMKSRLHADGHMRREQIAHDGWEEHRDSKIAQRTNSDHDDVDHCAEPEFEVTRPLAYHLDVVHGGKPRAAKLRDDESPINQNVLRLAGKTYCEPDLGAHCVSEDGESDVSDLCEHARYAGHRQLSVCMLGAAMRGARPWFSLDVFTCHMFGLADAPTLAKRIGRSAAVVRAQLVAAYTRMARARTDAARGNKDARNMLATMIEVSAKGSAFERADLTVRLLTGRTVPRQLYLGDGADAAAGLAALRTPCPMLTAYRHPDAPDAASELAGRRAVPADVLAAKAADAARIVTHEERKATSHVSGDRATMARYAAQWEKQQKAVGNLPGLEAGLEVGRTFRTREQREDAEKARAPASEFTSLGSSPAIEAAEERAATEARENICKKVVGKERFPTLSGGLPQLGIIGRAADTAYPPSVGSEFRNPTRAPDAGQHFFQPV
jgi:hypothetical protein